VVAPRRSIVHTTCACCQCCQCMPYGVHWALGSLRLSSVISHQVAGLFFAFLHSISCSRALGPLNAHSAVIHTSNLLSFTHSRLSRSLPLPSLWAQKKSRVGMCATKFA
jgi:hypothetical protein